MPVSISISQQIGANILDLKAGIEQTLRDLAHSLPAGLKITKVYDLAEFVATAIANVREAILIGGFLAVIVLIVFLRDLRLTLIAAVTLPLAVIPTLFFLHVFGGSINLMSMGGLAVAIGLVIDDAVVVVENIHRRASEGADSVADAVSQLMAPLTSSTLTTVVVFAPLGLLSGVVGTVFPRVVHDAVGGRAAFAVPVGHSCAAALTMGVQGTQAGAHKRAEAKDEH